MRVLFIPVYLSCVTAERVCPACGDGSFHALALLSDLKSFLTIKARFKKLYLKQQKFCYGTFYRSNLEKIPLGYQKVLKHEKRENCIYLF